jgi:nicotinamide mononucleotide transporter
MARGWIEFWLCWIAVDLVGVPELIYFKFYPSAALYAIYAVFVVWGFFVWRRSQREQLRVDEPSAEVVGA